MPFKKVDGHYESPSGREYSEKQIRLYYALGGHFPKDKKNLHKAILKKKRKK